MAQPEEKQEPRCEVVLTALLILSCSIHFTKCFTEEVAAGSMKKGVQHKTTPGKGMFTRPRNLSPGSPLSDPRTRSPSPSSRPQTPGTFPRVLGQSSRQPLDVTEDSEDGGVAELQRSKGNVIKTGKTPCSWTNGLLCRVIRKQWIFFLLVLDAVHGNGDLDLPMFGIRDSIISKAKPFLLWSIRQEWTHWKHFVIKTQEPKKYVRFLQKPSNYYNICVEKTFIKRNM